MKDSIGEKVFGVINAAFLLAVSFVCLFPVLHVLAISFSDSTAAAAGKVWLWPVDFSFASYDFVIQKPQFLKALNVTVLRVIFGLVIGMAITIITAYPLSRETSEFPSRTKYVWFLFLTVLFSGGLIPLYMTVRALGLIDSFWSLILPGALSVWNVILLLNFIRTLPKEVEESAFIDGAGHWTTLWRIIVPMSKPVLATLVVFTAVWHWNSWVDGLIFMNMPGNYPLQTYIQTTVISIDLNNVSQLSAKELAMLSTISDRTSRAAQIFVATLPIFLVYPFLQRYFIKGIVLGSVRE